MDFAEHYLRTVLPEGLADGTFEIKRVISECDELDATLPGEEMRVFLPGRNRTLTVEYIARDWLKNLTPDDRDRLVRLGHIAAEEAANAPHPEGGA